MITQSVMKGALENKHPGVVGGLVLSEIGPRPDFNDLCDGPLRADPQGTYGDSSDIRVLRSHSIDLCVLTGEKGNVCHVKRLSIGRRRGIRAHWSR